MATTKTTRTVDMRTLCLTHNPSMYSERVPQYRFSNGREFTKAPGSEYDWYDETLYPSSSLYPSSGLVV